MTTHHAPSALANLIGAVRGRRADRAERRRLEAELASFRTPAERLEIEAIVGRHDDLAARDARDILARLSA